MRFMMIYRPADPSGMEAGVPPSPGAVAKMAAFIEELTKSGVLLATDGLLSTALGARVRRSGDKVTVTDAPFSEAREVIGGFAIVESASKAEAVELAKRFLYMVGDGESEIRQMYDVPAMAG